MNLKSDAIITEKAGRGMVNLKKMNVYKLTSEEYNKIMGLDLSLRGRARIIRAIQSLRSDKVISIPQLTFRGLLGRSERESWERLNAAVETGIIFVENNAVPGVKSNTIRIKEYNPKIEGYTITDEVLLKDIEAINNLDDIEMKKRVNRIQLLDGIYLDVDVEKLKTLKSSIEESIKVEGDKKLVKKLEYQVISLNSLIKNIVLSNDESVYVYKYSSEKRLYTVLTSMPKELRAKLRDKNGNSFWAIDITASQPRLLGEAVKMFYINNTRVDIYDYLNYIRGVPYEERKTYKYDEDFIKDFEEWKDLVSIEIEKYKSFIVGDFYTVVMDWYNLTNSKKVTRDQVKKQFMVLANDYRDVVKFDTSIDLFFKYYFPYFHQMIELIKSKDQMSRNMNKVNGRYMSIFDSMSSIESSIILESVCSKFRKMYNTVNIFSIHDSIAVPFDYISIVKSLIEDEYKTRNIPLSIKIEDYLNNIEYKENEYKTKLKLIYNNNNNILKEYNNKENEYKTKLKLIYNNNNILKEYNNNKIKNTYTILCGTTPKKGDLNDTKTEKIVDASQIRQIDNNGSLAWMYRGTGKQQMKKSCKKFTLEQFIEEVNTKFSTGEWT